MAESWKGIFPISLITNLQRITRKPHSLQYPFSCKKELSQIPERCRLDRDKQGWEGQFGGIRYHTKSKSRKWLQHDALVKATNHFSLLPWQSVHINCGSRTPVEADSNNVDSLPVVHLENLPNNWMYLETNGNSVLNSNQRWKKSHRICISTSFQWIFVLFLFCCPKSIVEKNVERILVQMSTAQRRQ